MLTSQNAPRYVIVKRTPTIHWNLDYVTGHTAKIVSHGYQTPDLPFALAGRIEREHFGEHGPDYTDPTWYVAHADRLFDPVWPERHLRKLDELREAEADIDMPF